jgi:hypothetical protein
VQEAGTCWCDTLKKRIRLVKSLHAAQAPPQSGQGVSSLPPSITADTVFGVGQVGGVDFELSINSLFGLVHLLEAKVQILSNCMKNTGVQLGDLAFASENEFALAYCAANPSGAGMAGFVDFILIWQFATLGQADLSTWLMQERNAKAIGFSLTIVAKHMFTMSVLYPSALAGLDKTEISVNVALDALKSVAVWRGGTGDGSKERLTLAMTQAVQAHKKYCEDQVPEG